MTGNNSTDRNKSLELSKKMTVLRKLVCLELLSADEYILVKNRILDSYHLKEPEFI